MKTIRINRYAPQVALLKACARELLKDRMAVYPTDTFYGIGGNPFARELVERIYAVKSRRRDKPLILLLGNPGQLASLTMDRPAYAEKMARDFWPGPLTLVFRASDAIPGFLKGAEGTIAVRLPSSPVILGLVDLCGFPLTGSSANLSGHPSPVTVKAINREILDQTDLVIDGGPSSVTCGSTIVDCTGNRPVILREGAVPRASLKSGGNAG